MRGSIGIGLHLGLNQHGIAGTPTPAPSPPAAGRMDFSDSAQSGLLALLLEEE